MGDAHVQLLGKRALFLVPSIKVYGRRHSKTHQSVAKTIHNFLTEVFKGYTSASGNIYGYFQMEFAEYDELREFRVAVPSTKLQQLVAFLARLAEDIGEECIYLEYGGDAMLVYPHKKGGE